MLVAGDVGSMRGWLGAAMAGGGSWRGDDRRRRVWWRMAVNEMVADGGG